eukprot:Mrub_07861.p1 GENE.Mrub_07861~~Mrub_07861.p1  ORF type:complete len:274 (-),score=31.22 Mrub_07861:59-784(-)
MNPEIPYMITEISKVSGNLIHIHVKSIFDEDNDDEIFKEIKSFAKIDPEGRIDLNFNHEVPGTNLYGYYDICNNTQKIVWRETESTDLSSEAFNELNSTSNTDLINPYHLWDPSFYTDYDEGSDLHYLSLPTTNDYFDYWHKITYWEERTGISGSWVSMGHQHLEIIVKSSEKLQNKYIVLIIIKDIDINDQFVLNGFIYPTGRIQMEYVYPKIGHISGIFDTKSNCVIKWDSGEYWVKKE